MFIFWCVGGVLVSRQSCTGGMLFNNVIAACDSSTIVQCHHHDCGEMKEGSLLVCLFLDV